MTTPPRSFPKAALITAVCVMAGFWLGASYLPGPPTPIRAAVAYTEAGFARDWTATWTLICRSLRAVTDRDKFVDTLEHWAEHTSEPTDVDIETGDMELVHVGSRSYFVVTVKATTDEPRWMGSHFEEEVPLVQGDGEFPDVRAGGRILAALIVRAPAAVVGPFTRSGGRALAVHSYGTGDARTCVLSRRA